MAIRELSSTKPMPPAPVAVPNYSRPLAIVTTLFFMWGFLTCLNDVLVPHLKSIFDLNYTKVMLIQFAFFSAYFIFSIPSAKLIDWIGYKRTMVVGLLTMGLGALLFIPAAGVPSVEVHSPGPSIRINSSTGICPGAQPSRAARPANRCRSTFTGVGTPWSRPSSTTSPLR